jgi:hypothetical protein
VTATDDGQEPDHAGIERYEALRHQVLEGGGSGWRLGLALLERSGVSAWLRAWRSVTAPERVHAPEHVPQNGDEVVSVLACMALACIRAG